MLWKQPHERKRSQICSQCWSYSVKYRKKLLQTTIPLRKWIQLKFYSYSVKNVWISSLTLIFIFWWIELAILRSHRNVYQDFWRYLEKKICILLALNCFLLSCETFSIPSFGRDFIMWRILYVICSELYEVLGDSTDRIGLLAKT